jgi:Flp pilus assembly protein TadB
MSAFMKRSKFSTLRKILIGIYFVVAIALVVTSIVQLLGYEHRLLWAVLAIANAALYAISMLYMKRDRDREKDSSNQHKT